MGQEVRCDAMIEGKRSHGRALLETDDLIFRGDAHVRIPYRDITALETSDGVLSIGYAGRTAAFELGAYAEQWADRIRHPRSRLDKLGVKAGQRVALVEVSDAAFAGELLARGAELADGERATGVDLIFFGLATSGALRRLPGLLRRMSPAGAIWTLRARGDDRFTEADVRAAARSAGLVDTKVVRFSETHTAEKFVIPKGKR
jgi:hypothetical protein